jgi:hypothetical protein
MPFTAAEANALSLRGQIELAGILAAIYRTAGDINDALRAAHLPDRIFGNGSTPDVWQGIILGIIDDYESKKVAVGLEMLLNEAEEKFPETRKQLKELFEKWGLSWYRVPTHDLWRCLFIGRSGQQAVIDRKQFRHHLAELSRSERNGVLMIQIPKSVGRARSMLFLKYLAGLNAMGSPVRLLPVAPGVGCSRFTGVQLGEQLAAALCIEPPNDAVGMDQKKANAFLRHVIDKIRDDERERITHWIFLDDLDEDCVGDSAKELAKGMIKAVVYSRLRFTRLVVAGLDLTEDDVSYSDAEIAEYFADELADRPMEQFVDDLANNRRCLLVEQDAAVNIDTMTDFFREAASHQGHEDAPSAKFRELAGAALMSGNGKPPLLVEIERKALKLASSNFPSRPPAGRQP